MRLSGVLETGVRSRVWPVVAVSASLAVLVWFSYQSATNLERSQELLAYRRARERVDMLATALGRDMRGAQASVIDAGWEADTIEPPFEVRSLVAAAFARYPYPESFFAWRGGAPDGAMAFFNRSDRVPPWVNDGAGRDEFPVTVARDPAVSSMLAERIRVDLRRTRRYSTFELALGGVTYQVVAHLFYRDPFRERLDRVAGFMVNLGWVRQHYFPAMTDEVARIGPGAPLAIVDDRGVPVAGQVGADAAQPVVRRWFPLAFFDPLEAGGDAGPDSPGRSWAIQIDPGDDPELARAASEARRGWLMTGLAVGALALGLILTARAVRTRARLAELRSDFVSTVTHELKTPIATIRAVGETLAMGRVTDGPAMREYAGMIVQEGRRLTRLVENLLAYARVTDVTEVYVFEPLVLRAVLDDVMKGYGRQLTDRGFTVEIDMPDDLPPVRADRTSITLALDNLVDNAARYSGAGRWLGVRARRGEGRRVRIEVIDRGVGIPADQIPLITRRFVRGRGSAAPGSGLGLAIVSRIVADHGGRLAISSVVGQGTSVALELPAVEESSEEAGPDRRG